MGVCGCVWVCVGVCVVKAAATSEIKENLAKSNFTVFVFVLKLISAI